MSRLSCRLSPNSMPLRLKFLLRLMFFILCALVSVTVAVGQDEDEFAAQSAVVRRATSLRRAPSLTQRVLGTLQPDSRVSLLELEPRAGFFHVLASNGRRGWLSAADIALAPVQPHLNVTASASHPCKQSFSECTPIGCAMPGTPQALFNQQKEIRVSPTHAISLSFTDFKLLQALADNLVGESNQLSAAERRHLRHLSVRPGVTAGEGSSVSVLGFIAQGLNPHPNNGESVNCQFTASAENDFHIPVARSPGDTDFQGIVVEMVPQHRPAGWTTAKLVQVKQRGLKVLVFGHLFYDNAHYINPDAAHSKPGQPARFSLWEVHPITKFLVCTKQGNGCSPTSLAEWTPLENLHD
jgi:hypothetical protein